MSDTLHLHKEDFLRRWSRVKREVAAGAIPPGTVPTAAEAPLPSLETLAEQGLEGDFSAFMQTQVDEGVRRLAIQQLFRQPVFNVMDGLDVYIDDYSVFEPIAASELAGLSHARSMLFPELEQTEQLAQEQVVQPEAPADIAEGKPA